MANHFLVGLLLSAISLIACSKAHQKAFQQTEEIKKYGLVFGLDDYKQRIDYYESRGKTDRANLEKSKIDEYNRTLVQDFHNEFDFCQVRFYYASQTDEIRAGKPVLLNSNLEPDSTIQLPEKVILANYAYGKQEDNVIAGKSFRIEGTSIGIRTRYSRAGIDLPLEAIDLRKINKRLHKMNKARN